MSKPLPALNILRKPLVSVKDPFMAQIEDPFENEIALADNRSLTLQLDALRKRLLRLVERTEPLCTLEDIGGK